MKYKKLRKYLSWIVLSSFIILPLLDYFTGWLQRIKITPGILVSLLLIVSFLIFNIKAFVSLLGVLCGLTLWGWITGLLAAFYSIDIIPPGSFLTDYFNLIMALIIYGFIYAFARPIGSVFKGLWRLFHLPQIGRILVYFMTTYVIIILAFGLLYATMYLHLGANGFTASRKLFLHDFIYFSVVTITTLGHGDIQPVHWMAKLLSVVEVCIGLVLVVIYLAVTISTILSEKYPSSDK